MIVSVFNDTRVDGHHGCSRVMHNILSSLYSRGVKTVHLFQAHTNWNYSEEAREKIISSDIIIVNGEGTIHHNRFHGLKLLELSKFCQFYKKPIYLVNALFQEMSGVEPLLKNFEYIYARDSFSAKHFAMQGAQCSVVPDLSFLSEVKKPSQIRRGIASTCSVEVHKTKILKQLSTDNCFNFIDFTHGIIPKILISPPKRTINYTNVPRSIYKKVSHGLITKKLYKGAIAFKCDIEMQDFISSLDLLISGRFHANCFAINSETPLVALKSNSHKVEALFHDAGIDAKRIIDDPSSLDINAIDKYQYSDLEKQNIREYVTKAKEKINLMFDGII